MVRELGPAVHGHLALARVEADDHVARELQAELAHEVRGAHGLGADDDPAHAGAQVGLGGLDVADAAADLHRELREGGGDAAHDLGVDGAPGAGAVEVDHVQPPRAGLHPPPGDLHRVVAEHRHVVHAPLAQAHALAVLDVDGGDQLHGLGLRWHGTGDRWRPGLWLGTSGVSSRAGLGAGSGLSLAPYIPETGGAAQPSPSQRAKLASRRSPARWLFSGWNCTAKAAGPATAAAKRRP